MTAVNTKEICALCRFFSTGSHMGVCRRYPETKNKSPNEWCGEYQEAQNKVIQAVTVALTMPTLELASKSRGRPKKAVK